MMKKMMSMILAAARTMSLTGTIASASDEQYSIGISQFAEHGSLDDCRNGFIKVYQIKPEGKNSMDAKSFYNGNGRNMAGETLG